MGLRHPDPIQYVAVSVGYEGTACDPEDLVMSDGLVKIEQSLMDMYHVFAVLDEGCNTTRHSHRWAEMAESRLKRRGLAFPFADGSNFTLHLPQNVTLEPHQVLRLPRKVRLEAHQMLHMPRKVTPVPGPRHI